LNGNKIFLFLCLTIKSTIELFIFIQSHYENKNKFPNIKSIIIKDDVGKTECHRYNILQPSLCEVGLNVPVITMCVIGTHFDINEDLVWAIYWT
jgi:hypothetical protein